MQSQTKPMCSTLSRPCAIISLPRLDTLLVRAEKKSLTWPLQCNNVSGLMAFGINLKLSISAQQTAFEQYIRGGGGYVGIHAAADTEYDWPWYNQLVGAYFLSHPKQQSVDVVVHSQNHPSTSMLPDRWKRFDELYNYKKIVLGIKVLATLDESTYKGGANGVNHPFIWYREFDGGRSFYTGGGHTDESFVEPLFVQHLLGGIEYAMGRKSVKKPM